MIDIHSATRDFPRNFPNGEPEKLKCEQCAKGEGLDFEFDYAYQPIVDIQSRTTFAHEALVRGLAGEPAGVILGKVNEGNRYRFDQACRVKAVAGAARLGMSEFLSINFLPNAVYRPELCIRTTLEAAELYKFDTKRIIFEVTEGEKVTDRAHLGNIITKYKEFGFLTAIDDFGAGYAGLTLLAEYQPNLIKLDMELVRNIDTSRVRQAIVKGMMVICNDLGIRVIAEGIETAGERDALADAGITLMQGYLFCKPVFRGLGQGDAAVWA
jgi:EAL domain-containing protein (putative c-di-GMP-specific phosphodiesterase class I)